MKTILWIILAIFLVLVSNSFGQDPGGFRGMYWGQSLPPKGFNLELTDKNETMWYIKDRDEDFNFGLAQALNVYYRFWRGQFYMVKINFKGYSNHSGMHIYARDRFGKPSVSCSNLSYGWMPAFLEDYECSAWDLPKTVVVITIHRNGELGSLNLASKVLSSKRDLEIDKEREQAKEKKKKD